MERIQTIEQVPQALNQLMGMVGKLIESNETITHEQETPITIDRAAEILHLKIATIYLKTRKNEIPHYFTHGKLYFFESELIEYIKTGKVPTKEGAKAA